MQPQASALPAPLRVFIVEDTALIRARIEEMIVGAGAALAGNAAGVQAAIGGILEHRPDIVVLDIQLADGSGLEVLRALHDQAPEIDVYMLSNYAAYPYRQIAERFGARGFFDKSKEFDSMRDAVAQRVAARH
jgi:DNA-binding NarL/FixJ family response regulator